jgi:hypothetical protein
VKVRRISHNNFCFEPEEESGKLGRGLKDHPQNEPALYGAIRFTYYQVSAFEKGPETRDAPQIAFR